MNEDPIVAEVRRIREKHASRLGYDIHKIFADLIVRGNVRDPSHPVVQDASKWAETPAAETLLTLKEDPPPNH